MGLETKFEKVQQSSCIINQNAEMSKILMSESRDLLQGERRFAYDYVTVHRGIYGDDIENWANSEMMNAMKKLIILLESGMKFKLSDDLIKSVNEQNSSQVEAIRILQELSNNNQSLSSRQAADGSSSVITDTSLNQKNIENTKIVSENLLKASNNLEHSTSNEYQISSEVVVNENGVKIRKLLEKHAKEVAQLENELRKEEVSSINNVIQNVEKLKNIEIAQLKKDLKEKLSQCINEKEKEQIIEEYLEKIRHTTQKYEKQKRSKLELMKKKLLNERQRKKKELHEKHTNEAIEAGLDAKEVVGSLIEESEEELQKELTFLQEQQDRLIRELKEAWAEDKEEYDGIDWKKRNEEMEERIRMLNAGRPQPVMND